MFGDERKDTVGKKLREFLRGGWVFLMTALVLSWFIWFLGEAKDSGPFVTVVQFGLPSWFGVNFAERFAPERRSHP